jgi:hypothetical protein
MFVQGGSDVTGGCAGEYENSLFLRDPGFTLNGLENDFSPRLLNMKDRACLKAYVIPYILGNNNPSEPVYGCFHDVPPIWQNNIPNGNCPWARTGIRTYSTLESVKGHAGEFFI